MIKLTYLITIICNLNILQAPDFIMAQALGGLQAQDMNVPQVTRAVRSQQRVREREARFGELVEIGFSRDNIQGIVASSREQAVVTTQVTEGSVRQARRDTLLTELVAGQQQRSEQLISSVRVRPQKEIELTQLRGRSEAIRQRSEIQDRAAIQRAEETRAEETRAAIQREELEKLARESGNFFFPN